MNLADALQEILFSLKQNKLRTFLTGFGVFWGIFMLILLLGAGTGLRNGAEAEFTSDARDSVWLFSRRTSVPYMGLNANRDIRFTSHDLEAILRDIPGIKYASAENPVGSTSRADIVVRVKDRSANFGVFGVAENYFHIKKYQDVLHGRKLNAQDEQLQRKVAYIGKPVADQLFPNQNPIGKNIEINQITFKVVGEFFDKGRNGQMSERIYIPMSIFQKAWGQGQHYYRILTYQPESNVDPIAVEQQVVKLLKQRHRVAPQDRSAIQSHNMVQQVKEVNALFAAINSFIWFVGIGTLTAGIVGISNIMLITVKERTVEIGVRKALGARPINIISALLFESVLITAVAGYVGLVCGVGLLELVNYILKVIQVELPYFHRPEVDFQLAITAICILICVGVIAGFAPAWRAARISPVEAMRN
ncbi:Macrolide export ATP-binding/permease protein MacB [Thalassocella blandensis]|nr:Macrolide export ATP-binding/permease protein MacB [Thalassocella blandensis]